MITSKTAFEFKRLNPRSASLCAIFFDTDLSA